MFKVIVDNQTTYKFLFKKIFEKILREIAIMHKINTPTEVGVIISDNKKMHQLNWDYRKIDNPTDILSFPQDYKKLFSIIHYNILGDIYFSYEKVLKQAKEYNHSIKREWCYLFAHGLLHLLGYEHKNNKNEKKMNDLTDQIMEKINVRRN